MGTPVSASSTRSSAAGLKTEGLTHSIHTTKYALHSIHSIYIKNIYFDSISVVPLKFA